MVQEPDGLNVALVAYTRGPDLSGTLGGAGGIGGLLARTELTVTESAAEHVSYGHDGNGNVTCLLDGETVVGRYQYDPFGNTLTATGPAAEANLYRFSSKELHPASGLIYYLYRFYDPSLQRWPNRDPLGEGGGYNLYAFVENDPANAIDPFGENKLKPILKLCWAQIKAAAEAFSDGDAIKEAEKDEKRKKENKEHVEPGKRDDELDKSTNRPPRKEPPPKPKKSPGKRR